MLTRVIDPELGEVIVACSRRSRRIVIRVVSSDGVRLSFPPHTSQKRAWEFLLSRKEWILKTQASFASRVSLASISEQEIEQLRVEAKATLPPRVEELAQRYGFQYGKVTIRATKSKWGSCSAKCDISLSLFLMKLPQHLRDYIIIHELSHTRHHNHSAAFHALVDKILEGRERALHKELKGYHLR